MAQVALRNVVKHFDKTPAVQGIDLDIADRDFVVLVGPSGCGKTTTLRMIAGLEEATSGEIYIGDQRLAVTESSVAARPGLEAYVGRGLALGIRPEDIEDAGVVGDVPADRRLGVTVDIREDMGSEVFVHFGVQGQPVRTEQVVEALEEEAVEAIAERSRRSGIPFIGRLDRTTRAREGEPLDLAVDVQHLHFFDPETGLGIYGG